MPTASVVIPCYRQGHLLAAAVRSALANGPLEVIVVNDGSDDDTAAVAASFGPRVVYVGQRNGGLAAARNSGLALAAGDYIHFLDADDELLPGGLAKLLRAVADAPDAVAVGRHREFTADPSASTDAPDRLPDEPLPSLLKSNPAPPCCWLVPRVKVVALGGFDARMNPHEDWDLWLRLALHGCPLRPVREAVALYRVNPQSMSGDRGKMFRSRVRAVRKMVEEYLPTTVPPAFRRDAVEVARRTVQKAIALGVAADEARLLCRAVAPYAGKRPVYGLLYERAAVLFCQLMKPAAYRELAYWPGHGTP